MTKNEAIQELSRAKSVQHWNLIRSTVVDKLSRKDMADIDSSGLIVQVLGADKPTTIQENW